MPVTNLKKAFTLLELVVVIIIIAILASLGLTQYNTIVEKARLTETRVRIGLMRTLATEYYYKYGSLDGIGNSDVEADNTCTSTNFYRYVIGAQGSTWLNLAAYRCTGVGKSPDASRQYVYYLQYFPGTGQGVWECYYPDDGSSCFGL